MGTRRWWNCWLTSTICLPQTRIMWAMLNCGESGVARAGHVISLHFPSTKEWAKCPKHCSFQWSPACGEIDGQEIWLQCGRENKGDLWACNYMYRNVVMVYMLFSYRLASHHCLVLLNTATSTLSGNWWRRWMQTYCHKHLYVWHCKVCVHLRIVLYLMLAIVM